MENKNISIDKDTVKDYNILPELLLEMGMVKSLDLDNVLSQNIDKENNIKNKRRF